MSDAVPLLLSRALLTALAERLPRLPPDAARGAAAHALAAAAPRAVSYEEPAAALREALAALHEARQEWSAAARALAGIDLDSGMRQLSAEYKLGVCVKVAMLYLEDDDAGAAEAFVKRAAPLAAQVRSAPALELQFRTCSARVLDAKRRFLEAGARYYDLSTAPPGAGVGAEDLATALQAAITCAVLAPAGAQRSRLLATLYKDERAGALPVFPLLEKVYLERILRPAEVEAFAAGLAPHQRARLPDGATVLERAVTEHNLEAASRVYANVHIAELAALLGCGEAAAEAAAARMASEGRLAAELDQVEGLVSFGAAPGPLARWDANVEGLCRRADEAAAAMAAAGLGAGGAAAMVADA
jgi:COP9 signalosome complex subunit 4